MRHFFIVLSMFFSVFCAVCPAYATTTLGVASDTRVYWYSESEALADEYINYFADQILPTTGDFHGFAVGPSGSNLTVFTSYAPWEKNIYLLSNTGGDNFPISFGGQALGYMGETGQIDGYRNPAGVYYGALLPSIPSLWTTQVFEESKMFYLYTAPLAYAGTLGIYDQFFAVADINGTSGLQFNLPGNGRNDDFSPKTTSAGGFPNPVPEPGTLLMLGMGLMGMGAFSFRKRA